MSAAFKSRKVAGRSPGERSVWKLACGWGAISTGKGCGGPEMTVSWGPWQRFQILSYVKQGALDRVSVGNKMI